MIYYFTEPDYHFIIKSSIPQMIAFEQSNFFEKEMEFYTGLVPSLNKIDPTIKFSPKCYFVGIVGGTKLIILQDLCGDGFKMIDRLAGFDLEHCKLYFSKIGALHALTASYYERNKVNSCFKRSMYTDEMRPMHVKCMELCYPVMRDTFKKNAVLRPYLGAIKDWDRILLEAAKEKTKINLNDFNVLNHGDSWVNNMLFLYDSKQSPTDVWLIDYQFACYGSPVIDLFYFFVTSANNEVREKHFDELIQIYHTALVAHLLKYKYSKPIPSLRQLHMDILSKGFFATILLVEMSAVVVLDSVDTAPIDKILEDNENGAKLRYKLYNNPRYIKMMATTMKFLQNRGLLEA